MLCTLFTFCAEVIGLSARVALVKAGDQPFTARSLFPDVTLVIALVTGTLCLVLLPVVYRLRKTPPPVPIMVIAILVGLTPWVRSLMMCCATRDPAFRPPFVYGAGELQSVFPGAESRKSSDRRSRNSHEFRYSGILLLQRRPRVGGGATAA
jgi:hypothetical protein